MKAFLLILLFVNILFSNETSTPFQNNFLTQKQKDFIENHPIIKVSNEKDWAPYDYNENGIAKGYSIDYLNLLAKKIGVTFIYETDTWTDLLNKVKHKRIDIIHPISMNKSRKEYLHFSDPLLKNNLVLVTSRTTKNIKNLNDMENRVLGVGKNWNSTKILQKSYPKIIFKEYPTSKGKLEAVAFGEIDAAIDSYLTINYIIQQHLLNNLEISGGIKIDDYSANLHIGIRKDWEIFKGIINLALKNINQNEILEIKDKWFNLIPKKTNKIKINFSKKELEFLTKKNEILMCVDPNWMPYESIKDQKHIGMFSDYFKIFRERLPIPIKLVPTISWTQTLEFAKDKKCDIISGAVKTPKRSQYLNFTVPYIKLPLVLATKPDKPFVSNMHDVLPYKIAMIKSYAYIELLRNKYPNIQIVEVSTRTIGLEKVLSGDVYGFIDTLASVGNKVQKDYFGNIKIAGKLDEEFILGIGTRKDMPALKTIFDKAINSLTVKEHQDISRKWVSVKYEKVFNFTYALEALFIICIIIAFFIYRQFILEKQNQELQKSVDEFEHLINATMGSIFILEDNRCIDSNIDGVKLLGYDSKEELIGLHVLDVIDPKDHALIKRNLQKENTQAYELNARKKDGTIFPVLIKGNNFTRKGKKIRVTAMLDLTELKQKERLLSENSKMVALGEMLGNIAHQWRQPLSVISTAASGVRIQKELAILKDEVFFDSMDGIINSASYLSKTIDDFNTFIKEDKEKRVFNLSTNIDRTLTILSGMIKLNDIQIILDIEDNIEIDNFENELLQALINIISNAKDILVENSIKNKLILISTIKEKDRVLISIKDNAGGVPDDIINRIFEPYFTTKHKTQGTGLGLYMVHQIIIDSMDGDISVKNSEFVHNDFKCQGAEFTIVL